MITLPEFLMGREVQYPLTLELALNAAKLLAAVNYIRGRYNKPLSVSSGYRPGHFNRAAGGAKNSSHITCEAIDIADPDGEFAKWCLQNIKELVKADLYMEEPSRTRGWCHLSIRPTLSGRRVFLP